jgi:glycosyltransferase involved in cell wall biosynthesis
MNILVLQDDYPPNSYGGAGIIAEFIAENLAKDNKIFVSVFTIVNNKKEESTTYKNNIKIIRVYYKDKTKLHHFFSLYNPDLISKLKKELQVVKPEIVIVNNIHKYISYYALNICKKSGARIYFIAHDALLFHYGKITRFNKVNKIKYKQYAFNQLIEFKTGYIFFRKLFIRNCLRNVEKILSVSLELKKALFQNNINNVDVLHNGIDYRLWEKCSLKKILEFKKRYKIENKKIILFNGRLTNRKGIKQIFEAFKLLNKKNFFLIFVGKPSQDTNEALSACSDEIKTRIIFTGWLGREEMIYAYHASNVVVVPSTYLDPFPTVILEAMASSKPVVGSIYGGSKEIIKNNFNGYLVNPFNTKVFASKLNLILSDNQLAYKLGNNGKNLIKEKFSSENYILKLRHKLKIN